ncbi:hypothetical protein ABH14_19670 [Brevibacillus brevis]|nr:hypothetical protein [Brevibacillus brevis]
MYYLEVRTSVQPTISNQLHAEPKPALHYLFLSHSSTLLFNKKRVFSWKGLFTMSLSGLKRTHWLESYLIALSRS